MAALIHDIRDTLVPDPDGRHGPLPPAGPGPGPGAG